MGCDSNRPNQSRVETTLLIGKEAVPIGAGNLVVLYRASPIVRQKPFIFYGFFPVARRNARLWREHAVAALRIILKCGLTSELLLQMRYRMPPNCPPELGLVAERPFLANSFASNRQYNSRCGAMRACLMYNAKHQRSGYGYFGYGRCGLYRVTYSSDLVRARGGGGRVGQPLQRFRRVIASR